MRRPLPTRQTPVASPNPEVEIPPPEPGEIPEYVPPIRSRPLPVVASSTTSSAPTSMSQTDPTIQPLHDVSNISHLTNMPNPHNPSVVPPVHAVQSSSGTSNESIWRQNGGPQQHPTQISSQEIPARLPTAPYVASSSGTSTTSTRSSAFMQANEMPPMSTSSMAPPFHQQQTQQQQFQPFSSSNPSVANIAAPALSTPAPPPSTPPPGVPGAYGGIDASDTLSKRVLSIQELVDTEKRFFLVVMKIVNLFIKPLSGQTPELPSRFSSILGNRAPEFPYPSRSLLQLARETDATSERVTRPGTENIPSQLLDRGDKLLSEWELQRAFPSVDAICTVSSEILTRLTQPTPKDYPQPQVLGDLPIGTIFEKLSPFLKIFSFFCAGHATSAEDLQFWRSSRPSFQAFVSAAEKEAGETLDALMIQPVQRVPRLLLLLTKIRKYTPPSHPDCIPLVKAVQMVTESTAAVNDAIGRKERQSEVFALQKRLQPSPEPSIVEPHREMVMSGTLEKVCRPFRLKLYACFLLSDLFVYASGDINNESSPLQLHGVLQILGVSEHQTRNSSIKDRSFRLLAQPKSIVLVASTKDERDKWMQALQMCIEKMQYKLSTFGAQISTPNVMAAPLLVIDEGEKSSRCQICKGKFGITRKRNVCMTCGEQVCNTCSLDPTKAGDKDLVSSIVKRRRMSMDSLFNPSSARTADGLTPNVPPYTPSPTQAGRGGDSTPHGPGSVGSFSIEESPHYGSTAAPLSVTSAMTWESAFPMGLHSGPMTADGSSVSSASKITGTRSGTGGRGAGKGQTTLPKQWAALSSAGTLTHRRASGRICKGCLALHNLQEKKDKLAIERKNSAPDRTIASVEQGIMSPKDDKFSSKDNIRMFQKANSLDILMGKDEEERRIPAPAPQRPPAQLLSSASTAPLTTTDSSAYSAPSVAKSTTSAMDRPTLVTGMAAPSQTYSVSPLPRERSSGMMGPKSSQAMPKAAPAPVDIFGMPSYTTESAPPKTATSGPPSSSVLHTDLASFLGSPSRSAPTTEPSTTSSTTMASRPTAGGLPPPPPQLPSRASQLFDEDDPFFPRQNAPTPPKPPGSGTDSTWKTTDSKSATESEDGERQPSLVPVPIPKRLDTIADTAAAADQDLIDSLRQVWIEESSKAAPPILSGAASGGVSTSGRGIPPTASAVRQAPRPTGPPRPMPTTAGGPLRGSHGAPAPRQMYGTSAAAQDPFALVRPPTSTTPYSAGPSQPPRGKGPTLGELQRAKQQQRQQQNHPPLASVSSAQGRPTTAPRGRPYPPMQPRPIPTHSPASDVHARPVNVPPPVPSRAPYAGPHTQAQPLARPQPRPQAQAYPPARPQLQQQQAMRPQVSSQAPPQVRPHMRPSMQQAQAPTQARQMPHSAPLTSEQTIHPPGYHAGLRAGQSTSYPRPQAVPQSIGQSTTGLKSKESFPGGPLPPPQLDKMAAHIGAGTIGARGKATTSTSVPADPLAMLDLAVSQSTPRQDAEQFAQFSARHR